jgi:hypothetical protein
MYAIKKELWVLSAQRKRKKNQIKNNRSGREGEGKKR